jgi:hypothetical protein
MRPEELGKLKKIHSSPSGLEPATSRSVTLEYYSDIFFEIDLRISRNISLKIDSVCAVI